MYRFDAAPLSFFFWTLYMCLIGSNWNPWFNWIVPGRYVGSGGGKWRGNADIWHTVYTEEEVDLTAIYLSRPSIIYWLTFRLATSLIMQQVPTDWADHSDRPYCYGIFAACVLPGGIQRHFTSRMSIGSRMNSCLFLVLFLNYGQFICL